MPTMNYTFPERLFKGLGAMGGIFATGRPFDVTTGTDLEREQEALDFVNRLKQLQLETGAIQQGILRQQAEFLPKQIAGQEADLARKPVLQGREDAAYDFGRRLQGFNAAQQIMEHMAGQNPTDVLRRTMEMVPEAAFWLPSTTVDETGAPAWAVKLPPKIAFERDGNGQLFALDQRTGKPIGDPIGSAKPAATRGEKLYRSYSEAAAEIQRQGATDTHAVRQDPVSGGFYITEKRGNDLLGSLISGLGGGGMPKVTGAGGRAPSNPVEQELVKRAKAGDPKMQAEAQKRGLAF